MTMGSKKSYSSLLWWLFIFHSIAPSALAFCPVSSKTGIWIGSSSKSSLFAGKKVKCLDKSKLKQETNRIVLADRDEVLQVNNNNNNNNERENDRTMLSATFVLFLLTVLGSFATSAIAASPPVMLESMNPANFQPVCPASDEFYRVLQGSIRGLVGPDQFVEYGPLIASGLLRVRLELCVVESFFSEAVIPFIQKNGLVWVLPLHETVETFLAGTVFATATTFILVGSSKLLTVIFFYGDLFFGAPCRTLGGFVFDRASGKPVTLDIGIGPLKTRVIGPPDEKDEEGNIVDASSSMEDKDLKTMVIIVVSGAVRFFGKALEFLREFFEGLDLFVGRYLVLLATAYIGIKFIHFKIFPDFP